jgi:hypothetical protein
LEIIGDLSECQKPTLVVENGRHVRETDVEAAKRGEDEGVILDNLSEITKSIRDG